MRAKLKKKAILQGLFQLFTNNALYNGNGKLLELVTISLWQIK